MRKEISRLLACKTGRRGCDEIGRMLYLHDLSRLDHLVDLKRVLIGSEFYVRAHYLDVVVEGLVQLFVDVADAVHGVCGPDGEVVIWNVVKLPVFTWRVNFKHYNTHTQRSIKTRHNTTQSYLRAPLVKMFPKVSWLTT
jgi:hypothetical protein